MYPTSQMPHYGAFVWQQAEQLRRFGHTVDIVNILGFRSKLNYLKGAVDVVRKTSSTAYDIVHAHYGLTAFPAWFRFQAPLVITLHGSDLLGGRFERLCSRIICRFSDAVIVVSEEMRQRVPGIVIPCGIDLNLFRPYKRDEARARLGWPLDKYLILFPFDPGRRVKRYDRAKAAVERLSEDGIGGELITVFGVDNREMPWHYSAADAMILCSDREGSPTSVKEALACNLPVVSTDVGDVREIMSGIAGTEIVEQSPVSLAAGLRRVLNRPPDFVFDGRTAMERYSQQKAVEAILAVYRRVIEQRLLKHPSRRDAERTRTKPATDSKLP